MKVSDIALNKINRFKTGYVSTYDDFYYLLNDVECKSYFDSEDFIKDITELLQHDRIAFDEPQGWGQKSIGESPLINDLDNLWNSIKASYTRELKDLAFSEIPDEKDIASSFKQVSRQTKQDNNISSGLYYITGNAIYKLIQHITVLS